MRKLWGWKTQYCGGIMCCIADEYFALHD